MARREKPAWLVAAAILVDLNEPLHYEELTRRAQDTGLTSLKGSTPSVSLFRAMRHSIRRGFFRWLRRGMFEASDMAKGSNQVRDMIALINQSDLEQTMERDVEAILDENNYEEGQRREHYSSYGERAGRGVTRPGQVISLETLRERQREATEIGELGEAIVLRHERKFLGEHGRPDLADRVHQISVENVAAGYDILSFTVDGAEKLIEVKACAATRAGYEITANELSTAQRYRDRYWIYRVTGVRSASPKIAVKLQDPWRLVQEGKLILKPVAYEVVIGEAFDDNVDEIEGGTSQ